MTAQPDLPGVTSIGLVGLAESLFGGLIDYAGLFPPASLDMPEAVAEYRASRHGGHAWMLGRFIVTAGRLEELAGALTGSMTAGEDPWPISVILDGDLAAATSRAQSFDAHMGAAADIVLVEVRAPAQATDGRPPAAARKVLQPIATAAHAVSPTVTPFVELNRSTEWPQGVANAAAALAQIAEATGRVAGAKLRCGGLDAASFPTPEEIACFLIACRDADIPFKATAGLHHPVRHEDLELGVHRHGFLNLLTATTLAETGHDENTIVAALSETDPTAFAVTASRLAWRDRALGLAAIRTVRDRRFPSYGSCSFAEPVDDLIDLGLVEST